MRLKFRLSVVRGHLREILISYLLTVRKWVIEVVKDIIRLKVFLLIINDCLEPSNLSYVLDFIS
jgi:hypothetical protein